MALREFTLMRAATRWTLIILAALAVPLVPFAIIGELPGDVWLSARDQNAWAFALTGTALLMVDVLLPIPSSIVGTMLGARLGFWPGLLCCFIGLMTGQLIAYFAARWLLRGRRGPVPVAPAILTVFLSRPVPVLAEAVAISAGVAGLGFMSFLAACAAGNIVYALVLAGNGAALLPGSLLGLGLIIPMLLPAGAWLIWRRMERHPAKGE